MKMRCTKIRKWINDYIDGDLDSLRRQSLENHLKDCSGCRELLKDFQTITHRSKQLGSFTPSRHVWGRIQSQLNQTSSVQPILPRPLWRRPAFPRYQLALTAFVLLIVMGGVVLFWPGSSTQNPSLTRFAERQKYAFAKLEEAEKHYLMAIQALQDATASLEKNLDPGTAAIFKANLGIINFSITACRQVVLSDPEDIESRIFLLSAYKEKAGLLDNIVRIRDNSLQEGKIKSNPL